LLCAKADKLRLEAVPLLTTLVSMTSELIDLHLWQEMEDRLAACRDIGGLVEVHAEFLARAQQQAYLDAGSSQVFSSVECALDAISTVELVVDVTVDDEDAESARHRAAFARVAKVLDHARIQLSLSLFVLSDTLSDFAAAPNANAAIRELLLRSDLNEFYSSRARSRGRRPQP